MMPDWIVRPATPELAQTIASEHAISPITAQLLINRGLTEKGAIHHFFHSRLQDLPDPLTLPDIDTAVAAILKAIAEQKRIVLFGDYDVDGMTGTAILYLFLAQAGADVRYYIPDRKLEGYGLNSAALEAICRQGCDLLITIDNGTSAFAELAWARERGMDAIVIDHHETPTDRPRCLALINPKHPESRYPDRTLCSAALAFNLAVAVRSALRTQGSYHQRPEPDLRELLDLVALGTIADLVPLQGQNRLLARYGLWQLNQSRRPGINALKEVSGLSGRPIGTYEIGFILAPRLNAAGRLADARTSVRLLTTQDRLEGFRLAGELERLNRQRQAIEKQMLAEAIAEIERSPRELNRAALVVAADRWHPGVIGIVASRLAEQYRRPAFVIALQGEKGTGSARSYGAIDLYSLLAASSQHLLRYGGHQAAAGFSIHKSKIPALQQGLQATLGILPPAESTPPLQIDQELTFEELSPQALNEWERLSPFGIGNPPPLFASPPIRLVDPRIVGDKHLKVTVAGQSKAWPAIGFGLAPYLSEVTASDRYYEIAYRPEWNEFRGERTIQLVVAALRAL